MHLNTVSKNNVFKYCPALKAPLFIPLERECPCGVDCVLTGGIALTGNSTELKKKNSFNIFLIQLLPEK